jgi:hypothetical protein
LLVVIAVVINAFQPIITGISSFFFAPNQEITLVEGLARIFHSGIEQRSGEGVKRLDITQPNENTAHRFFWNRL